MFFNCQVENGCSPFERENVEKGKPCNFRDEQPTFDVDEFPMIERKSLCTLLGVNNLICQLKLLLVALISRGENFHIPMLISPPAMASE